MRGKEKCRILKEIRQKIADENDIPYVTKECSYQGNCKGTCPRCESELRYLEHELAVRRALGKKVTVAALCAGMSFAAAGCTTASGPASSGSSQQTGSSVATVTNSSTGTDSGEEIFVTEGEVAWEPEDENVPDETDIEGAVESIAESVAESIKEKSADSDVSSSEEEFVELEGDVPYFPEEAESAEQD